MLSFVIMRVLNKASCFGYGVKCPFNSMWASFWCYSLEEGANVKYKDTHWERSDDLYSKTHIPFQASDKRARVMAHASGRLRVMDHLVVLLDSSSLLRLFPLKEPQTFNFS